MNTTGPDPDPIADALIAADLVDPDDPDLAATCGRIRDLCADGATPEQVADHLDTVERLGAARDDWMLRVAQRIVDQQRNWQ